MLVVGLPKRLLKVCAKTAECYVECARQVCERMKKRYLSKTEGPVPWGKGVIQEYRRYVAWDAMERKLRHLRDRLRRAQL